MTSHRVWAVVNPEGTAIVSTFSKSPRLAWDRIEGCQTLEQRAKWKAAGFSVRKVTILVEPDGYGKRNKNTALAMRADGDTNV